MSHTWKNAKEGKHIRYSPYFALSFPPHAPHSDAYVGQLAGVARWCFDLDGICNSLVYLALLAFRKVFVNAYAIEYFLMLADVSVRVHRMQMHCVSISPFAFPVLFNNFCIYSHVTFVLRYFQVWVNQGDIILVGLRDFQDSKADVILKYTPDEARNLKTYGEFPESVRINETVTFVEDGFDEDIEFGDEISSDEEADDVDAI